MVLSFAWYASLAMAMQQAPPAVGGAVAATTGTLIEELRTVAEQSGYLRTARHAEVVALMDGLAAKYPLARRAEMGKTVEGRSIPMIIIADPPVSEPPAAGGGDERVVVLAIGNIHAGEVDGKEALPILARDILERAASPENRALLKNLIIIFAPIYNADGNERVAKGIRGGQNGPEETGIRENAQGFDLNRDFIKLEAPETRALVGTINRWDPAVFIDCHITNGSFHRYLVTYAGAKVPAGDGKIIEYSRESFFPSIAADFAARTPFAAFWYGNFNGEWGDQSELRSRWETFPAEGRYGTNYFGLRGRLSVLVETYTYAPFQERVRGTVEFVRSTLWQVASRAGEIRELVERADVEASGAPMGEAKRVAIRSRESPWAGKVTIAGFEETMRDGRRAATETPKDYEVELWDKFEPALTVEAPEAYIVPAKYTAAIETLRAHGIIVETLAEKAPGAIERTLEAEIYRVDSTMPASRKFQGHSLVKIEATSRRETRAFEAGSLVIRTNQPLGRLAVYLLEPMSDDGLATWNFFDEGLRAGQDFPVARVWSAKGIERHIRGPGF